MKLKDTGLTAEELKDIVKKYMVETYARYDFIAERAEGMYLYDEKGAAYLDFYGGVAVNTPGNRNPKVVAAVKDQLDDIMHTFNYPYTIPQALLAKKICQTLVRLIKPSSVRDTVCNVLELCWCVKILVLECFLLDDLRVYLCNAVYAVASVYAKCSHFHLIVLNDRHM